MVINNGPDRADLLRAVSNRGQLALSFESEGETLSIMPDRIEEGGADAEGFTVWGRITNGTLRDAPIRATYNAETRIGSLQVQNHPGLTET
jgi:hypothetical protein